MDLLWIFGSPLIENILLFSGKVTDKKQLLFFKSRSRGISPTKSALYVDAAKPIFTAGASPILLHPDKEPRHNYTAPAFACRERSSGNADHVQSELFEIPLGFD